VRVRQDGGSIRDIREAPKSPGQCLGNLSRSSSPTTHSNRKAAIPSVLLCRSASATDSDGDSIIMVEKVQSIYHTYATVEVVHRRLVVQQGVLKTSACWFQAVASKDTGFRLLCLAPVRSTRCVLLLVSESCKIYPNFFVARLTTC
jgi:hypothetical protein